MTKDDKIALVMLPERYWRAFKTQARYFYKNGAVAPAEYFNYLPHDHWAKIAVTIDVLRAEKRPQLEARRRAARAEIARKSRRDYMRQYMRKYRKPGASA